MLSRKVLFVQNVVKMSWGLFLNLNFVDSHHWSNYLCYLITIDRMSNFSIVKNWCLPSIQSFVNTLPSGRIKVLSRCQHRLSFCSASRTLINLPPREVYLDYSFISLWSPVLCWPVVVLWLYGPMVDHGAVNITDK